MILEFGDGFFLRGATAADHPALLRVCLQTGDAGEDATNIEDDGELLGLIYAVPYQVLEPDFAYVVDSPGGVAGYLFGAPDTLTFNLRLAMDWYPALQQRIDDPGPDRTQWRGSDWARRLIHHPDFSIPDSLAAYPSHGHIDLLPAARGRGIGKRAMAFMEHRLAKTGSAGLFLQLDPRNEKASRFYTSIGYEALRGSDLPGPFRYLGKRLAPPSLP